MCVCVSEKMLTKIPRSWHLSKKHQRKNKAYGNTSGDVRFHKPLATPCELIAEEIRWLGRLSPMRRQLVHHAPSQTECEPSKIRI